MKGRRVNSTLRTNASAVRLVRGVVWKSSSDAVSEGGVATSARHCHWNYIYVYIIIYIYKFLVGRRSGLFVDAFCFIASP